MKKLVVTFSLVALATAVYAQGTVDFLNSTTTRVQTNSVGMGGTAGTTALAANGFYYALLTAPSSVTSASGLDLLTPTWTFTGNYGTNTAGSGGGRLVGGGLNTTTLGAWPAGVTNRYVLAGWSANVAGSDWNSVKAQLTGGSFAGGVWTWPNGGLTAHGGFYGISDVTASTAFGSAGGGTDALPSHPLFGPSPIGSGTPIPTGFTLFVIQVPEPSTLALAGLGAAALLLIRRRK